MPRDSNGNYTLPSGNPVVSGTTVESAWANTTMDDLRQAMTDSLDRFGRGGMQAPFRFVDGTAGAPGMSWASEISSGFFRAGGNDMRATIAGIPRMRWTGAGVDVWDSVTSTWIALVGASGSNFAVLNAVNNFTSAQQRIVNTSASWAIWKDATPTLGARFSFNLDQGDSLGIAFFDGAAWRPKMVANATLTQFLNDEFDFYSASGATLFGRIASNVVSFGNGAAVAPFGATKVLGIAQIGVGNSQLVAFVNDANSNPRTSLFAFGDGSAGIVGIDWNADFIAPISGFEFRRANVPIARYTANSLETLGGARLGVRSPNNATNSWCQQDNLGASYWNTDSSVTSFQWYLSNVLCATMGTARLSLGRGLGTDYTIAQPVAGGAIQIRGDGSTTNRGLSLGNVDNAGVFTPALQMGDFVPGVARFLNGLILQVFNGANNWSGGFNVPVGNNASAVQYVENGAQRGGMLWHNDATFRYGGIFVSTSAAPATGGTPGQIWLQTAT